MARSYTPIHSIRQLPLLSVHQCLPFSLDLISSGCCRSASYPPRATFRIFSWIGVLLQYLVSSVVRHLSFSHEWNTMLIRARRLPDLPVFDACPRVMAVYEVIGSNSVHHLVLLSQAVSRAYSFASEAVLRLLMVIGITCYHFGCLYCLFHRFVPSSCRSIACIR